MLTTRPKVAELQFHLYERTLHPELFQIHCSGMVERGDYQARIDITSAGHVVTWNYRGLTLTEVAAAANQPLPEKRRLFRRRVDGKWKGEVPCRDGIRYQISFQLERVEPEIFWTIQQELAKDGKDGGLVHQFQSSGRMAMGALSLANAQTRDRKLMLQAFHTFPDDLAIVHIQSHFELP